MIHHRIFFFREDRQIGKRNGRIAFNGMGQDIDAHASGNKRRAAQGQVVIKADTGCVSVHLNRKPWTRHCDGGGGVNRSFGIRIPNVLLIVYFKPNEKDRSRAVRHRAGRSAFFFRKDAGGRQQGK